jgi:predicted small integral membrane protein
MLSWMHWTWKSGLGFVLLAGLLIGLAVLDRYRPGYGRKGFLPIVTTRGDRVFMSLAAFLTIVFLWLKYFPEVTRWWVFPVAGVVAFIIMRWA